VNRGLRKLAVAALALFVLLLANATRIQVVDARSIDHLQSNPRPRLTALTTHRGDIRLADGTLVAHSERAPGAGPNVPYQRSYPLGSLMAPITGWAGVVSTRGIEQSEDDLLSGNDDRLAIRNVTDTLLNKEKIGGFVTLSIDRRAQQAGYDALQKAVGPGGRGALVALDVKTGAVLALVSLPSYDPTPLAGTDGAKVQAAYNTLNNDKAQPLLDRATQRAYHPGSVFKLVDSAAALASGRYDTTTLIPSPDRLPLPLTSSAVTNFSGESCGGAMITLAQALKVSCNTAFAGLGVALGQDALRQQAQAFGWGTAPAGFPLPVAPSIFPTMLNAPQTAFSALGQFSVDATPLQIAMVVQAIADGGSELAPYLVAEEDQPNGSVLTTATPKVLGQPMSSADAATLTQLMLGPTGPGGTAPTTSSDVGVPVAGKTGTAQNAPGQPPHAWFAGFAPADAPQVAVAVVVEAGGSLSSEATGGAVSAPVAVAVLKAALADRGKP